MSPRFTVRFLPSGREVAATSGTFLTTAAIRAGVEIVHDCDGQGVCGTCRVEILSGGAALGPSDPRERIQLGAAVEAGWRLCCLLVVRGDCEVRVPGKTFAYPPALQRAD